MTLIEAANAIAMPKLYDTESIDLAAKTVWLKFFTPWTDWTWYVIEYDPRQRICWGWVVGLEQEAGYFALDELEAIRGPGGLQIEQDRYFQPIPLGNILGVIL